MVCVCVCMCVCVCERARVRACVYVIILLYSPGECLEESLQCGLHIWSMEENCDVRLQ